MRDITADCWFDGLAGPSRLRRALQARAQRGGETAAGRRGRHRERGHFPVDPHLRGPFALGHFGLGGPGPFGRFPFGGGAKARRGDVRAAALLLLADAPHNGYQLMQEIESRSGGLWRPSPGSIYPVLQQLEDEGLVRPEGPDGRRHFQLTDAGRAYVVEHAAELGTPWSTVADSIGGNAVDFRGLIIQLVLAARQVMHAGDQRQVTEALAVLGDSRRRLYRILAEDERAGADPASTRAEDAP